MGLIGFMLAPMYAQRSVDYLATSDFVRRPLLWLRLISENRATVTYSPSFGYDLAAKRASRADDAALDLSQLRVAGIGGDMVRPEALNLFTEAFASAGFRAEAFLPSYGMAEATLAVTFTALDGSVRVDDVDMRHYTRSSVAQPASAITQPEHKRGFVLCGKPLPGHDIEVRSDAGEPLGERAVGRIFIKGPSLTPGYFSDSAATAAMYHGDWLDTGDMGYMLDGEIVITGRAKDLIIINGRNIWPQDIEWAVEKVDGVRQGGVAAFSVDDGRGERIVVIAERRGLSADALGELHREVARTIQSAAGAPATVVLAKPHSMVLTSSGKLSRAKVKQKFLAGEFDEYLVEPEAPKALAEARL
jgi:fatty-acyl-CoA synthase